MFLDVSQETMLLEVLDVLRGTLLSEELEVSAD